MVSVVSVGEWKNETYNSGCQYNTSQKFQLEKLLFRASFLLCAGRLMGNAPAIQNGRILDHSHALMLPKIGGALLFGSSLPAEKVAPGLGIRFYIAGALLLGVGLPAE